jgi:hypothetical protein
VRQDRSDDEGHVTLGNGPVDADLYRLLEEPLRELHDFLGRQAAHTHVGLVVPPRLVEHRKGEITSHGPHRFWRHRSVGPEGHHRGARADPGVDRLIDRREEQGQGAAPGGVRYDQAEGATIEVERIHLGPDERPDCRVFEDAGHSADRSHERSSNNRAP